MDNMGLRRVEELQTTPHVKAKLVFKQNRDPHFKSANMCCLGDLDDVFAYTTPKNVIIRDRRLGLAHKTFLAGIMFYIVVWQLGKQK